MSALVVVDLEATCWTPDEDPAMAADQRNETEVIEIGAVRLDPVTLEEIDRFASFVRPVRHPRLSAFCTELTSITQAQVDAASRLPEVWPAFLAFMDGDADTELAAWGAFDARQLARDARRHGLPRPRWTSTNLKRKYADHLRATGTRGRLRTGLGRAIEQLGWTFEGTPHRALDDAVNAARVLRFLRSPPAPEPST